MKGVLIAIILVSLTMVFGYGSAVLDKRKKEPVKIDVNITGYEKKLQDFEWKISGLNDEIKELRAITDEFRAQIKGLQKEVLIGIQEGGM